MLTLSLLTLRPQRTDQCHPRPAMPFALVLSVRTDSDNHLGHYPGQVTPEQTLLTQPLSVLGLISTLKQWSFSS